MLTVTKATPTITWNKPADITAGTALGSAQFDATASVPGTFAYRPAAGTVLPKGQNQLLSADFTPTDTADYTTASVAVTINVASAPTSPVTITSFRVGTIKVGMGRLARRVPALSMGFSGALSSTAAQNLAAYMAFSGTVRRVRKVVQVLYNKPVPLRQAIYFPANNTVALLPTKRVRALPKLQQLRVNVTILTDPMGRPINNGKNFTATATKTGPVVSSARSSGSEPPTAAAVDALFEQESGFVVRGVRHGP
jgi:hypothetical protein